MKYSYILSLLFLTVMISVPAHSQTVYLSSCPGVISQPVHYQLTANLDVGAFPVCIEVTGQNSLWSSLDLDCAGFSILGSSSSSNLLSVHDNLGYVAWRNCNFNKPIGNYGVSVIRSGQGQYFVWTLSTNNHYNGAAVYVSQTHNFQTAGDVMVNANFTIAGSDYFLASGTWVDNSAGGSLAYIAGFSLYDSQHFAVLNSVVNGHTGGHQFGGNVDDGVTAQCLSFPLCTGGRVDHVTVSDVYDMAVELTGPWTGVSVTNGNYVHPLVAGFGCLGAFNCSLDNSNISGNTVTATGNHATGPSTALIAISGPGTANSFFTQNTFANNTISIGNATEISQSSIGYPAAWNPLSTFGKIAYNRVGSNIFGAGVTVTFQDSTSTTDTGGNYCTAAYPSPPPITCH